MSRFGKLPVVVPAGVEVKVEGGRLLVKGPKGELKRRMPAGISVKVGGASVTIGRRDDSKAQLALQGTIRSHLVNMIKGATEGWTKVLELVGTGYRAEVKGSDLVLQIGYSHPVTITAPEGVTFGVEKSQIKVTGIDLEKVGQVSAEIRAVRVPDVYKGKGIRYQGEFVRKKPGKQAAKAAA